VSDLPDTELLDAATADIDRLDDEALARVLVASHRSAVEAALAASAEIARATTLVVEAIEGGGRVVIVGAGTVRCGGPLRVRKMMRMPVRVSSTMWVRAMS
jgi:N-acetylmuramic acid 6-phosphate (MurNAc-6-P) etherase